MIFLSLLLSACFYTQNSDAAATATRQQLVQCKWQLDHQTLSSHDYTGTDSSTVKGNKQDYILFHPDGTAIVSFKGNKDTLDYTVADDGTLSFGQGPYQIVELSSTVLRLYQNEDTGNGSYNREWLELRKAK